MQVPTFSQCKSIDGSLWSRAVWTEGVQVTLRQIVCRPKSNKGERNEGNALHVMCVEHLLREMDNLRCIVTACQYRGKCDSCIIDHASIGLPM